MSTHVIPKSKTLTRKQLLSMDHNRIEKIQMLVLLLPGVILYAVFNFIPLLGTAYLSLFDWPGIGPMEFVGLDNFKKLFANEYIRNQFFNAAWQNVIFFIVVIGSFLTIGTGLALLLSFNTWGRKGYQLVYFLPYPLAAAGVAFIMSLFVESRGPLNHMLKDIGLIDSPYPFLGDENSALISLALFYSWHRMGFAIMLVLSAILSVRMDLVEAAFLDGASRLQAIKNIVFPVLAPAFVLITVIVMVDVFNNADYTLILMGPEAGPYYSTDVMGTFLFRTAFGGAAQTSTTSFGMAAAIGLVTAIMILPAALFLALKNVRDK